MYLRRSAARISPPSSEKTDTNEGGSKNDRASLIRESQRHRLPLAGALLLGILVFATSSSSSSMYTRGAVSLQRASENPCKSFVSCVLVVTKRELIYFPHSSLFLTHLSSSLIFLTHLSHLFRFRLDGSLVLGGRRGLWCLYNA